MFETYLNKNLCLYLLNISNLSYFLLYIWSFFFSYFCFDIYVKKNTYEKKEYNFIKLFDDDVNYVHAYNLTKSVTVLYGPNRYLYRSKPHLINW